MKQHCLSKEQLDRFIEIITENGTFYDDETEIQYLVDSWENWEVEFICFATFLSQLLERRLKQGQNVQTILEFLYSLPQETGRGFTIGEFNDEFIAYMLLYDRQPELSLEEDLIEIQSRLSEYHYPTRQKTIYR